MSRTPLAAQLEPEETESLPEHTHDTPFSLALDLQEASEMELQAIRRRFSSCQDCRQAILTLDYWLAALDHFDPCVGPELLTRHRLFGKLFLQPQTHQDRLAMIRADALFHHWGLCRLLLEESREALPLARAYAWELAHLALVVALELDDDFYDSTWTADLRAETAAHLAEVHHYCEDPKQAEESLEIAHHWFRSGTGRPQVSHRIRASESLINRDTSPQPAIVGMHKSLGFPSDGFEPGLRLGPLKQLFGR